MLSITKIFQFEAAHRISNYNGACSNIHGHSYELHVSVSGSTDPSTDIIFDFKDLKKVVESAVISKFDHALLLKENATDNALVAEFKTLFFTHEPTAERMLDYMANAIISMLPPHIKLKKLKLFETKTSYAEWEA